MNILVVDLCHVVDGIEDITRDNRWRTWTLTSLDVGRVRGQRGAKPFEPARVSALLELKGVEREAGCCRSRWADQGFFVHGKYWKKHKKGMEKKTKEIF